jgi:ankyrin repeat protein
MTLIDYVKLRHITKIQELIAQGVNLDVQDEYGYTALMWAVNHSQLDIVKLLLDAGADKTIIDNDKHDCLFWANYYGQKQIIKLFSKETPIKEKKGK